jgi:uncharacterized protein YuzE
MLAEVSTDFAYYDREADIAWLRTGVAKTVVSEEVGWGLLDHDRLTNEVVGIEIWAASSRLPAELLEQLPAPIDGS